MKQQNNQKQLTNNTLFSNAEYKIDDKGNIEITKHSLMNKKRNLISLGLINPEPMIEHKPESKAVFFSNITFAFAVVFFTISQKIDVSWFSLVSGIFIFISVLSFVYALKNKETVYTFFFENTKTKIFSIVKKLSPKKYNDEKINQCENFIDNLKRQILSINLDGRDIIFHSNKDKQAFLTKKLEELYNYGVVNDTVYSVIEKKIIEKINTNKKTKVINNIIAFHGEKKTVGLL